MLVLVPCPLVLISSCPCCHWATNGTSLETQHQGISESLMTQLQKWIFLAEETKTGVVLEKKNPLVAALRCRLKNGMFCKKRCFQPFFLALDLETCSLMWRADLGP